MQPIDVGDLQLSEQYDTRQTALFHAIREKIVQDLWSKGSKLPSTRKLAVELSVSRNTVIYAYEQLVTEGYIESRKGSGFCVSVEQPEHFLNSSQPNLVQKTGQVAAQAEVARRNIATTLDINSGFVPGVPDLNAFPFAKWQRLLQRHSTRQNIAGNQDVQGSMVLRDALSGDTASHTQEALADFVREGDLLRHIRKMRRSYKLKYEAMIDAIESEFNGDLQVISQAAGLHVTVKWGGGISENEWSTRAELDSIIIRPFSFYEYGSSVERDWNGALLGFGNVRLAEIKPKIKEIARLFYQ